jgi:flagellin-like protein
MRLQKRHGVSEIVGVLLMLAIVVSLGTLIFAFANGSLNGFSQGYAAAMKTNANAASEKFVIEQVAFPSSGTLALDGTSTNEAVGGSSSIATTLTTTDSDDAILAYVSPADTGSATPPSVSGISGGGLTWTHRATTPTATSNQYYVPVTITNNAVETLSIDGPTTSSFSTTNAAAFGITTVDSNDIIVVLVTNEDTTNHVLRTVNSVTATGLTFAKRSGGSIGTSPYSDAEVWWALAASPLNTVDITVTLSGATDDCSIVAFGVNGANTASPWDPNASLPKVATATTASIPSVSGVSTNTANDMILGFTGVLSSADAAFPTETSGSGFALAAPAQVNAGGTGRSEAAAEYKIVSAMQSSITVPFGTTTDAADNWIMVGDAIQGVTVPTPTTFQQLVTWDPATYSTYEATNLGNVRFCADDACSTPLSAWLESCSSTCSTAGSSSTSASAWVKLTSAISGGGGTLTIYMVFEAIATNFDGNYWGEAPTLSPTYAQYDNGANVFLAYFDGDTPTSDFTVYTGLTMAQAVGVPGPGAATINAIEITGNTAAHDPSFAFNQALSNAGVILESSFTLAADAADATGISGLGNSATATSVTNAIAVGQGDGGDYFYQGTDVAGTVTIPINGAGANPAAGTWLYSSLTYTGASEASFYAQITPALYGVPAQSAGTGYSGTDVVANPLSAATNVYMGSIGGLAAINIEYDLMRARAYPPVGAMPSTSFGSTSSTPAATFDLEEWYAVAAAPLSSVSITATLSTSDTAATWVAVFGVSGADTAVPFDPSVSLPATSWGATPSTTMSTSNANDMLLYACSAGTGGMAPGFTSIYSDTYTTNPNEYVGYEGVSATQTNLSTSCGTNAYGAEITDAVVGSYVGADIFVRNVGSLPTTLVSVYITDLTSNAFVSQTTISVTADVGTYVEIVPTSSAFAPSSGHTYSFKVTSSLGNSVVYNEEAT